MRVRVSLGVPNVTEIKETSLQNTTSFGEACGANS